jgi:hypothetical protein
MGRWLFLFVKKGLFASDQGRPLFRKACGKNRAEKAKNGEKSGKMSNTECLFYLYSFASLNM